MLKFGKIKLNTEYRKYDHHTPNRANLFGLFLIDQLAPTCVPFCSLLIAGNRRVSVIGLTILRVFEYTNITLIIDSF